MQATAHTGSQDLANILEVCQILDTTDHHGLKMYVAVFDGHDVLIFADSGNHAFVVHPPESFDRETGSIHSQAREMLKESAGHNG